MSTTTAYWLSRAEAAQMIGVTSKTLANWASMDQGPPFRKIAGKCRYRVVDIRDWQQKLFEAAA